MWCSLNGRSSKLDFDDVQLITLAEPEIKMVAINRNRYEKLRCHLVSVCTRYYWDSRNQTGIFVVEEHNGTNVETAMLAWVANQRWLPKPEVEMKRRTISAFQLPCKLSTKFKRHPHFWDPAVRHDREHSPKSRWVVKMATITRSTNKIT